MLKTSFFRGLSLYCLVGTAVKTSKTEAPSWALDVAYMYFTTTVLTLLNLIFDAYILCSPSIQLLYDDELPRFYEEDFWFVEILCEFRDRIEPLWPEHCIRGEYSIIIV